MKNEREPWFLVGLFTTALATLSLETLDTRLLSVLTWYHLSFLAVSLAMLGMAAAAIRRARRRGRARAATAARNPLAAERSLIVWRSRARSRVDA